MDGCAVVRLGGDIGFLFRFPLVCVLPLWLVFLGMDRPVSVLYLLSESADYLLFLSLYPFCSSLIFNNTDHIHHPVSLRLYL